MTELNDERALMSILLGHTPNTTGLNHTEIYERLLELRKTKRDDD